MENKNKVGRPKKGDRVRKQMFLNADLAEKLKGYSADEVNTLISAALFPPISSLNGFNTSPNISQIEANFTPTKLQAEPISSPDDSYKILKSVWTNKMEYIEEFVILLLNFQLQPIGYVKISQGGIDSTLVDSRVIFQIALVAGATGIILSHNHPSGSLKPSQGDIELTRKLVNIGHLLAILVHDHLIITSEGYTSFRAEGLIY